MKVLVVTAHPSEKSFAWALRDVALAELRAKKHDIRIHDLWQEKFDPVFTKFERLNHVSDPQLKFAQFPYLHQHAVDVQWCEALVLIYPTWWSAQPAILKGWIDRVFMNEVAWKLEDGKALLSPNLQNIRNIVVITTHGSRKWLNWIEGEGGKRIAFRSIRTMFHWRAKSTWIAMYGLDTRGENARQKFKKRVQRKMSRLFPA